MSPLERSELAELLSSESQAPCISIYQPTHRCHPDNQQDPIRFRNLIKTVEDSLRQKHSQHEIKSLLEPFHSLAGEADFWNHTADGLAVLGAANFFRVFQFSRTVAELGIVADTFHVKPLIRILQSADRYQILALSRKAFQLFEGNRDGLNEVQPARGVPHTIAEALGEEQHEAQKGVISKGTGGSVHYGSGSRKDELDAQTEKFFRAVDRTILEHYSRPSHLPLILAALTENQAPFRHVSHNTSLVPEGIEINPDAVSLDDLRERAWRIAEPHYLARLAKLTDEYGVTRPKGLATDDLADAADAAVAGRVSTLLIEADRQIPGRINPETGRISFDDLAHPGVDDLLDDLAEIVLKKGGDVVVVPTERMPTKLGAAALYRF